MKIGILGAPGSGKTVFSARLYAEILERGVNSARLVPEYAHEHLGAGCPIESLDDQEEVSLVQKLRQDTAEECNFNPIICDSALWIGGVYIKHKIQTGQIPHDDKSVKFLDWIYETSYDITVHVPLFKTDNQVNQFRIHDYTQSQEIEQIIKNDLTLVPNVFYAPKTINDREHFIKYLAGQIIERM